MYLISKCLKTHFKGGINLGLDNLDDVSTVKQLSEFLKVTELTIRRAIKAKELKAFKVGREWRIEKEQVLIWLDQK